MAESQFSNKTILVAVNDVFFYTKVRDVLRNAGYCLETARTVESLREKAAQSPAAVILNMNDDKLDAFRALEEIRNTDCTKTVPVLAFANHEEIDTWRRARELGVTKIVSRNEFSARTRDLVEEIAVGTPPGPVS